MTSPDNDWRLEPSWPGLSAERDGVTYDDKRLAEIVGHLRASATITGQGSCADVGSHQMMLQLFGEQLRARNWEGGETFARALTQSNQELTAVYQEVTQKLGIAIALIKAGANNYQHADTANES